MINKYRFGHIIIDGKEYTSDLKIFPDRLKPDWWREQGHRLAISDIQDVLDELPDILIIGTGSAGVMRVPDDVQNEIRNRGIELIIEPTESACNIFNKISKTKRVVAVLHLTC